MSSSPFLQVQRSDWVAENALAFAIRDKFPVSPGHTLVIPKRTITSWFEATHEEQHALLRLVDEVKRSLDATAHPDGYNVGFNDGSAAGQTVMHLHLHVIPRFHGDMSDPRGGVRHVIPSKGNHLASSAPLQLADGLKVSLASCLLSDLDHSVRADLAVAFILPSGLRGGMLPRLRDIVRREGSRVRVLTGDYQDVTDPSALRELLRLQGEVGALEGFAGEMECRVFETARAGRAFHPKAYLLYADRAGTPLAGYVGSSNLSHSALHDGVEWNLRIGPIEELAALRAEFEELFRHTCSTPLTAEWIRRYERRRKPPTLGALPTQEVDIAPELESPAPAPQPHAVQQEALAALEATRTEGNQAGLVVLATGLGKTWLAAFDSTRERGFKRVLFVAHRDEILRQAADTFAKVRPHAECGFYTGEEKSAEADVLFASIQTLSRATHLRRFAPSEFDYIVIDEFHHADARSYRNVLEYFDPRFLLGLTATPERTDGGDLLALCQQNLVYECPLGRGIRDGHLSPFHYFGVADDADYPNIPWRSIDEVGFTRFHGRSNYAAKGAICFFNSNSIGLT